MSMLYGYINLDGRPADPGILENMGVALSNRKADAQTTLIDGSVAMGFKNQYITEESHFEALPYYDAETGLYIVCDAIIDNREELARLLGIKLTKETPDGRLIFESYKKWGEGCTSYLLGDFAFTVYDSRNRRAQFFRDHVGKRLIYYRIEDHCVYFSTLIKPLLDPWGNNQKPIINEQYLVFFFAIQGVRQDIFLGSTIFRDISYVSPGGRMTITEMAVSHDIFWDPQDIRHDRRLKKADYVEEFKEIFKEAVRCRLRTDGEVGVMLSGGLDSSSVACVAASILREQNKELHTYTSVPIRDFTDWTPRYITADESPAVKMMQASYPNMNMHFVDSKEKNSLNVANNVLDIFEQPYKFIDNSFWLDEIFQTAANDSCKIIMSGAFGNSTISYGSYWTIFFEHILKLRGINFIKDFNAFCLSNRIGRKKAMCEFADAFLRSIFSMGDNNLNSGLVKDAYMKKYNVEKTLHSFGYTNKPIVRDREKRRRVFDPTISNKVSSTMTKYCLAANICERDPTGDKRIVEFCLRLPCECFFDRVSGHDRGLIRRAMSGIVPDEILNNQRFGLQAADWLERIKPQWKDFLSEFNEYLIQENHLSDYLDLECIRELVKNNSELEYSFNTINNVRDIITIDNCANFVDML